MAQAKNNDTRPAPKLYGNRRIDSEPEVPPAATPPIEAKEIAITMGAYAVAGTVLVGAVALLQKQGVHLPPEVVQQPLEHILETLREASDALATGAVGGAFFGMCRAAQISSDREEAQKGNTR